MYSLDSILAHCLHIFLELEILPDPVGPVYARYHQQFSPNWTVNCGCKQTDLIIMDFAKAFGKVSHKLHFCGMSGSAHKWIKSWLSLRSQQILLEGQVSDPVPVLSGVPQGFVFGLILFLIFINDLLHNVSCKFSVCM